MEYSQLSGNDTFLISLAVTTGEPNTPEGASNATTRDHSGFRDFLQRLSREQPSVLKAQDWEAQFSNKQRLLLNSMKKTVRLVRDIVALERRCKGGGSGICGTR
jgi:hypothetical protein